MARRLLLLVAAVVLLAPARPRPVVAPPASTARPRVRLSVRPRAVRAGRRTRFRLRAIAGRRPAAGAVVRFAGRRIVLDRRGRGVVVARLRRSTRVRASLTGSRAATLRVRVSR